MFLYNVLLTGITYCYDVYKPSGLIVVYVTLYFISAILCACMYI